MIYQIFYDEKTRGTNDRGFLQLDNAANDRPDWSEYWPIRNFFLNNELDDDVHYGFLSPKFKMKTGLDAQTVHDFVASATDHDVIAFSPFFDQAAFAVNIFEQAAAQHEGIFPVFQNAFALFNPHIDVASLVMSSTQTIFCNYFTAKKPFWARWFALCEVLFAECENEGSALSKKMTAGVRHSGTFNPAKVFIVERMASYILTTESGWKVKTYDPFDLPYSPAALAGFRSELCVLDALKIAFRETRRPQYIAEFQKVRADILDRLQSRS